MAVGGYDFEIYGQKEMEDMKCPICLLLLKEVQELPCQHLFCKSCLACYELTLVQQANGFV